MPRQAIFYKLLRFSKLQRFKVLIQNACNQVPAILSSTKSFRIRVSSVSAPNIRSKGPAMSLAASTISMKSSPPASVAVRSGFIIGPLADSLLIIGAPLLSLILGWLLYSIPGKYFQISFQASEHDFRQILIAVFINAHLFLVYFRSHANASIFNQYPYRFTVVPLALVAVGALSPIALGIMGMVVTWWDVYHSSLQTFGFGRIYDSKQKNDAVVGRELDYCMNLLIYLGPVLAGAHFVDHLRLTTKKLQFLLLEQGGWSDLFLQRSPAFLEKNQSYLAAIILAIGLPFVAYYLYSYYRFQQQGYRVSWQKVWLLIITSSVSIYCWGFRSFIDAFWVMNFFHALQYFAIVGYAEKKNLTELFRLNSFRHGWVLALFWVIAFCLIFGLWSEFFVSGNWSMSLVVTTSIMHFWYDGFIWSVKKKQV